MEHTIDAANYAGRILTKPDVQLTLWVRTSCMEIPGNWSPASLYRLRASDFIALHGSTQYL